MTDTTFSPPAAETNGQLIVALAIVGALAVLGAGAIWVGLLSKNWDATGPIVGAIVGALATALNAPSGIAGVLRAGKSAPSDAQP